MLIDEEEISFIPTTFKPAPLTSQQRHRMNAIHRDYLSSPEWHDKAEIKLEQSGFRCSCGSCWEPRVRHLCFESIPCERMDELEVTCEYCRRQENPKPFQTEEERIRDSINPERNIKIGIEIRRLTAIHRSKTPARKQTQMENGL